MWNVSRWAGDLPAEEHTFSEQVGGKDAAGAYFRQRVRNAASGDTWTMGPMVDGHELPPVEEGLRGWTASFRRKGTLMSAVLSDTFDIMSGSCDPMEYPMTFVDKGWLTPGSLKGWRVQVLAKDYESAVELARDKFIKSGVANVGS